MSAFVVCIIESLRSEAREEAEGEVNPTRRHTRTRWMPSSRQVVLDHLFKHVNADYAP